MKRHFIILLLCGMTAALSAQTFGGGSGTQSDPYKISTPAHLKELATWVNQNPLPDQAARKVENFISYGKYFIQTGPIDMAEVTDFEPIGKYGSTAFAGHYDGQNYPIKNLKFNNTSSHIGLFGVAIGAEFKRIRMVSYQYTIKAKQKNSINFGSILGYMVTQVPSGYDESDILKWKVRITDCECSGTIIVPADSIKGARCGGIATDGYMDIRNCKSFLKMQCENLGSYKSGLEVGGIAYILSPCVVTDSTVIEHCLSRLDFVCNGNNPPRWICGIGCTQNSIRHCFSSGKIYANVTLGIGQGYPIRCCGSDAELHGAIAYGITNNSRLVSDCYFTGSIYDYNVPGTGSSKAPIASSIQRVENCYSAPSKLDAKVKSSLVNQITRATPIEPYPIRHCFVSSNVSAKDSAWISRPYNDSTQYRLDMYRMDDEAMKTPAFADTLNSYSGKKLWKQDAACNFGYPILAASPMPASAFTRNADSITGSSARLHATFIYGDEAANVLERGIAWKMREDKEWSKDTNLIKDNTLKLNGLQAKKVYMFRAYIERSVGGTLYGETLTFVTKQTDVDEAAADEQITVSPNPATSQIRLRDAQGTLQSLRVFNAVGQEVLRQELDGSTGTVNISNLSKGIYFLQIRTGHGTVMRKIAKN